jgi:hypothetical protein
MTRDANRLARIRDVIADVPPAPGTKGRFSKYLKTLDDQILLDRRIARAARADDGQSITVGLHQNQLNRNRRTQIARDLHLSRCLRDASATT